MKSNKPTGKNGGAEILIKADAEKAISVLKLVESAVAGIGSASASAAKAVGQFGLSLAAATPKTLLSTITGVGNALGAVTGAVVGIYRVSQIPFVAEQLKVLAQEGEKATQELVPLSDLLKTVGIASAGIAKSYGKDGFLFKFDQTFKPLSGRIDQATRKALTAKDKFLESIDKGFRPVAAKINQTIDQALESGVGRFAKGVAEKARQQIDQATNAISGSKLGQATRGISEKARQQLDRAREGLGELRKIIPPTPPPPPQDLNRGEEFIRSVKRARRTAVVQVKDLTQELISRLQPPIDQFNSQVTSIIGSLGEKIPEEIQKKAGVIASRLLDGIKNIAASVGSAIKKGGELIIVPGRFNEFRSSVASRINQLFTVVTSSLQSSAKSAIARTRTILLNTQKEVQKLLDSFFSKALGVGRGLEQGAKGAAKTVQGIAERVVSESAARLPSLDQAQQKIQQGLGKIGGYVSEQSQILENTISKGSRKVQSAFGLIGDRIGIATSELEGKVPSRIRKGFDSVRTAIRDSIELISSFIDSASSRLSRLVQPLISRIRGFGESLPDEIKSRLAGIRRALSSGLSEAKSTLKDLQERLTQFASSFSVDAPDRIRRGIVRLKDELVSAARQAVGLIKSSWEKIPDLMKRLGENVPSQIKDRFLGVKSRITEGMESVGNALKSAGARLLEIIRTIAGDFPKQVQERLSGLRESLAQGVASARKSILGTDADLAPEPPKPAPWQEPDSKMKELRERAIGYGNIATDKVRRIGEKFNEVPEKFEIFSGKVSDPMLALSGADKPIKIFEEMKTAVGAASEKIAEASQQVFFFTSAFDSLRSMVANGPYQMLVGQNVELRKQLLETQAGLVSTNKILRDGQQIVDPTSAIKALDAPVNAAIKKIRRDSLELVGVTSKDLVGVFNVINQSASQANISLKQSADLTSSFAAAMGTIGLPLSQARQEITSILQAQIDQNSVLAKTLGLDNQRVRQLAQQGKLYEFLTDKLKAFRAGNALAAQTIEGVTSNIQEMFDNITLEAGEQLIEPIVEQLNRFYQAINENRDFLTDYVTGLVSSLKEVGLAIAKIIETLATGFGDIALQIPEYLFSSLANGAKQFAEAAEFATELFRPLIQMIAMGAEMIMPAFLSPLFKIGVTIKLVSVAFGALHSVLKVVMSMLPGLSTLINLVAMSSNSMLMQLVNLTTQTGNWRIAVGLLAGRELPKIQGVMDVVTRQLGVFGGIIAPLIPQISQFAIQMIGLNKQFGITQKVPIAKMFDEAAGVLTGQFLPALSIVAKNKGLDTLSDQIDKFAEKATTASASTSLMTMYTEKFNDVLRQAGAGLAQKIIRVTAYTVAIAAAVVVISELWKRSEDAGAAILKLGDDISNTAELIRRTWDQTRDSLNKPLTDEGTTETSWIDKWIQKMREFEESPLEALKKANTLVGGLVFLFQVITQIASGAYKIVESLVRFVTGAIVTVTELGRTGFSVWMDFIQTIAKIVSNPLDFKGIYEAVDGFTKRTALSFEALGQVNRDIASDVTENWEYGFRSLEKSSEESFREMAAAIDSGKLTENVQRVTEEIANLESKIKETEGGSGSLFRDALTPLNTAVASLREGTGSIEDVRRSIAQTSQQFPELAKELEGVSDQISKEFPGDVLTASRSVDELGKSLLSMKSEGKTGLDGALAAIDRFKKGGGSIAEVRQEISLYRDSLKSFDDKKRIDSLSAPVNALENSLKSLDASASNRKIADISAGIDKDIEKARAQLQEFERLGKGKSQQAGDLREDIANLEVARDKIDALANSVKQQADPFVRFEKELGNTKTDIEKVMGDISNAQKESIAKIRVAQNANLDMDTGKERILSDSQARIEILKQETAAIQKEIPARYEALQKLLKLWNEMTPEEQESTRGKDLKRQMDAEQAALYDASARGAEKRAELEKAIAEKSISDIDRANKVALEKAQQAESERLVMLTQMRSQGLITAEEFEKQKADASVATAKKELEEQQKVLKSLEELPKPNDPDEAREREERIRAEKLKTSQATLKLIEAENAAYEAQTRKILAEIERRNDIIRAGLERRGRSGEITDSEKAEKEAALELKRLRAELAREKDANKRAELQLQLEKAKTSLQNARRQKEQEEFDRKLSEAEAAQLQAQREGGIDAEKAYTAVLERRLAAARRAVAIAKDANEKAKAQLELQRVLNDLEVDRIDRNLKAIENSYKRQNSSLQSQVKLFELAERSLANQKELIDAGNQLRASIGEYYDQTLGALSSLEKSDYRRRQLAEVTATIKLQAAIQEVKIAEQTLAIEQQMKRLALEREKIQARIAENEKLGNIKRLEAEEKKARIKGVSPEELEAIRIERQAAEEDYQLAQQSTALIDQQVAAQEDIFLIQQKIQQMQSKGKVEGAAANLIQNMADPGNQFNASEAFKEYLSQQLGAGSYSQLREGGLQSARNFQDQFFGQGFSRAGLQRDFFDIGKSLRDSQNQSFIATLPGASQRAIRPTTETRFGDSWSAASSPEARDLAAKYYSPSEMGKPQIPQVAPAGDLGEITGYVRGIFERMTTSEAARPASKGGVEVTIQSLTVSGNISSSGSVDSGFSTNFRRELEKVFNEAARQSLV